MQQWACVTEEGIPAGGQYANCAIHDLSIDILGGPRDIRIINDSRGRASGIKYMLNPTPTFTISYRTKHEKPMLQLPIVSLKLFFTCSVTRNIHT